MPSGDAASRLIAAAIAIAAVTLVVWAWYWRTRHKLRTLYAGGDVRGAAWVRFGRDGRFKGRAGRLVVADDGSVTFTPTRYDRRHGAQIESWAPGRVTMRWVRRSSLRESYIWPRFRVLELNQDGHKQQLAAYAVVGRLG